MIVSSTNYASFWLFRTPATRFREKRTSEIAKSCGITCSVESGCMAFQVYEKYSQRHGEALGSSRLKLSELKSMHHGSSALSYLNASSFANFLENSSRIRHKLISCEPSCDLKRLNASTRAIIDIWHASAGVISCPTPQSHCQPTFDLRLSHWLDFYPRIFMNVCPRLSLIHDRKSPILYS